LPFAGGNVGRMGNRLTPIESPQGFAAESSGASVILASSYFGYPLSTTHVVSGGVCCAAALIIGFLAMTKK
jgi:phosphate/sulfate permease